MLLKQTATGKAFTLIGLPEATLTRLEQFNLTSTEKQTTSKGSEFAFSYGNKELLSLTLAPSDDKDPLPRRKV